MTLNILKETADWLIAVKPIHALSEQTESGKDFADLLAVRNGGYIGVVHRLDREVGGVMLYAKTPAAAAWLSEQAQQHLLQKEYLAILEGVPQASAGELQDLLFYDRSKNKVYPVKRERKGVKQALLTYQLLQTVRHPETNLPLSLVRVQPYTGRTHQIRVQFASRKLPLLGDRKYGSTNSGNPSLWCYSITVPACKDAEAQTVSLAPSGSEWALFENTLLSRSNQKEEEN